MKDLALDRANANATVDAPVSAAEATRFLNDAYADVWELSGGAAKRVTSATAWTPAQEDGTGLFTGILTDVGEILHVWRSSTAGSVGRTNGDAEVVKVDPSRISHLRTWGGLATTSPLALGTTGEYTYAKVYAAQRKQAAGVVADTNKFTLEIWPAQANGGYFPIEYVPQFVPMTAGSDVPDVTDIESRDIALLAAARIAPLVGRAELVPGILMDISNRTQVALERKISAMLQAKQDR